VRLTPPTEGFPCDDLRKIFGGCHWTAEVPNGVGKLRKISTGWVGCTNVTDRQTQTDRQTDRRQTADVRATEYSERKREFAKNHTSKLYTKFSVRVVRNCGLVILWPQWKKLCTSGFVDDVLFLHNRAYVMYGDAYGRGLSVSGKQCKEGGASVLQLRPSLRCLPLTDIPRP